MGRAILAAGALVLALGAAAGAAETLLGEVDFPNSGAPAAQEAFRRGVLLLHSFEFEDAREAFQKAQRADPGFVLAHWGEAMTHNHPLWREQDLEAARAALAELGASREERLAAAPTPRERDWLAAVEALYGEGTKAERDRAYEAAMRRLSEAYPDDLEAKAFHALAILGTTEGERDFATFMRAAALAEEVFAAQPRHPGAAHYLIHSYDDQVHAPLGLRPARVYAEIAPAATHAQHMISHIFVALGDWEQTAAANEKAVAVSEARAERKGLPAHHRSHHALHWLEYAYLQQGRWAAASERLATMRADLDAAPEVANHQWHYAAMRAGWIVETRRFAAAPPRGATDAAGLTGAAADHFVEGWAAIERGDLAAARDELAALAARREAAATGEGDATDAYRQTAPRDLEAARTLEAELEGLLLLAEGRREEGLARLRAATAIEDALSLAYGPPDIVAPTHELLGEALLAAGDAAGAAAEFARALELAPRRARSLLGLAGAREAAGDAAGTGRAYRELAAIWSGADADVPELALVRARAAAAAP